MHCKEIMSYEVRWILLRETTAAYGNIALQS